MSDDFEGSRVLEKLAEIGLVDAFYAAVDEDNEDGATRLMKRAGVDAESIETVVEKMRMGRSK